jgi:hypothetical protein
MMEQDSAEAHHKDRVELIHAAACFAPWVHNRSVTNKESEAFKCHCQCLCRLPAASSEV